MSTEVLVALLALAGTLAGSFAGVVVANKLVNYRLDLLEKKVEQLGKLVERVSANENEIRILKYKVNNMMGDVDKCDK